MKETYIFKRYEIKYLLNESQKTRLLKEISADLFPDTYGKSTISSLYMDTPEFRMIRNSLDGKVYKEKLRLRSYGLASDGDKVFLEIKKKFKGVVYKRRVPLLLKEAMDYLNTRKMPVKSQIMHEIDYAFSFYQNPSPAFQISYDREAFYWKTDSDIRLTFDTCVRYRTEKLNLSTENRGKIILPVGEYILEVKTSGGMPLKLCSALDKCGIYPRSFSKYKNSYLDMIGR